MDRDIYYDHTPKWAPFALVVAIGIAVWWSTIWNDGEFVFAIQLAGGIVAVLLVGVFLQGLLYWKDQVERLTVKADGQVEARFMRWVGWSKPLRFSPLEATGWRSVESSTNSGGKFSSIVFSVRGNEYRLSLLSPKLLDLAGLRTIAPVFVGKLLADDPDLKSKGVGG